MGENGGEWEGRGTASRVGEGRNRWRGLDKGKARLGKRRDGDRISGKCWARGGEGETRGGKGRGQAEKTMRLWGSARGDRDGR